MRELAPEFSWRADELLSMEAKKLKFGIQVNPIVDASRLRNMNSRIENFCNGIINSVLGNFINEKNNNFDDRRFIWGYNSFDSNISEFENFFEYKESFLKNYNVDLLKIFLKKTVDIKIPDSYIIKLMNDINSYPALRTFFYSHLYLNFKFRKHTPARDRIPDSIQLIEACYFPMFISNDKKHLSYANEINPDTQFVYFKDFFEKNKSNFN